MQKPSDKLGHDCLDELQEIVPVIGLYSCKVCGSDFTKSNGEYVRLNGRRHA